ncbi:hypothetical protein Tco_0001755 [Tanacetum coccineum]
MAYTSQGSSSSDSEVHTCSKDCLKSYETLQKQYDQQCDALNKSNLEIIGYQMGLESLEARIVVHENNEAVYEEDIAFLTYDVQVKDISIKDLKNQLEEDLKEKDDLKLKLENFEESLKNLTKLINSQISAKDKAGLGYDSQMNKSEVVNSVFNSKESNVDDSTINDRFKIGEGFHVVPLPYTGNYMPSRPDLSFAGLDDYVYKAKVSETITTTSKTSKDSVEKFKTVKPSAPIIEDWDTDSDNDSIIKRLMVELLHLQEVLKEVKLLEKSSKDAVADDAGQKANEEPSNKGERNGQEKEGGASNKKMTQNVKILDPSISTARQNFTNADDLPTDPLIPDLEDTGIFSSAYDDEDVGAEADLNSLETTTNVSPIPTTRIHKDHPKDQIIGDINSATQTRRMTKISDKNACYA